MLEETARGWARQLRKEGQVQGIQKTLLRLMSLRFGRLPRDVRHQVEQITSVQKLEELTERVLKAKSLRDMGLG